MQLVPTALIVLCFSFSNSRALNELLAAPSRDHISYDTIYGKFQNEEGIMKTRSGRSIIPSEVCRSNLKEGICYGEITCKKLRGTLAGFCSGIHGACCVFYRTCGGRTSQEVSHFRNEAFPQEEMLKETCSFSVIKKSPSICGLRIELEKLKIPGHVGSCSHTFMWITGIPGRNIELLCGELSGSVYQFNITSSSEVFIKLKSYSGFKSSWSVTIKQLQCSEFSDEELPQKEGGSMTLSSTTPALPTSTESFIEAAEISFGSDGQAADDYSRCGMKGLASKTGNASDKTQGFHTPEDESFGLMEVDGDYRITWSVPELKESTFYKLTDRDNSSLLLDQRITFGDVVDSPEFPWQVAIFVGSNFHCGGSIIGQQHVLTAAHCLYTMKNNPKAFRIIVGKWDIEKSYKDHPDDLTPASFMIHQNYSRFTLENDIAIITLSELITFSELVSPICLPPPDLVPEGKIAYVTGWGRDEHGKLVTKLHKLKSAIIKNDICDKRWQAKGASAGFIVDSMVCMDTQAGDSCNGDSGGPSAIESPEGSGSYVQVGIVSFGSGSCTDKNLPGVYTRVPFFAKWIGERLNLHGLRKSQTLDSN